MLLAATCSAKTTGASPSWQPGGAPPGRPVAAPTTALDCVSHPASQDRRRHRSDRWHRDLLRRWRAGCAPAEDKTLSPRRSVRAMPPRGGRSQAAHSSTVGPPATGRAHVPGLLATSRVTRQRGDPNVAPECEEPPAPRHKVSPGALWALHRRRTRVVSSRAGDGRRRRRWSQL